MKYRIVLNGAVQGVGCRSLVRSVAKRMNLGGVVRNLDSGEVEVYIEAFGDKIAEKFVDEVRRAAQNTTIDIMNAQIFDEDQNEYYSSRPPKDY